MKEKTNMKKVLMTTVLVTAGMLAIGGTNSKAALQANPITHSAGKTYTGATLIQSIREMEASGQTMGLTETINADLTPTTSNNIDVHMMKSTEYGAVAILSASGFGYSGKLQDAPVKSTTGNVTGVYVPGNRWEWTAGVLIVEKAARYYDSYTINDQTSAKVGDALGLDTYTSNPGCWRWHEASNDGWIMFEQYGFLRGGNGIFSTSRQAGANHYNWSAASSCGRGVAVVKSGV